MNATQIHSQQPHFVFTQSTSHRPTVIHIGVRERPWANKRMQHGLGQFRLEPTSCIYFEEHMPQADWLLIESTLALVPTPLLDCARDLNLTMATCKGLTPNGNSSTCYADFRSYNKAGISPHIVMGSGSLTELYVLPHLVHELCHLYYASLPLALRQLWTKLLLGDKADIVEITEYAEKHKREWLHVAHEDQSYVTRNRFDQYAVETFCETVAALIAPKYRLDKSTVDLWTRRNLLAQLGLVLDIRLATSPLNA